MTVAEVCDVVYVILVDRLERRVAAVVAAGGDVDPDEERVKFDDALAADVEDGDGWRHAQLVSLGLR